MEKNYGFRQRLLEDHQPGLRDDALWKAVSGAVVDDTWEILYPGDAPRVIVNAAEDLRAFFARSLEVYPRLRAVACVNAALANPAGKIILTDADHSPALAPEYEEKGSYRLTVADGIVICGRTGRGTAQGVYYIEQRMGIHRGPVLPLQTVCRCPLFSPRMVHSGFGLDHFPDAHIRAIARSGMDALLIFVKDVDITPQGYVDFNDLIYRAEGYGVDVYAYSYYRSLKHPDDPDARAHYESTYGRLFAECPGFRGVVLVGESVEFPSKDTRTTGRSYRDKKEHPDSRPSPGWFPCYDYPQWVTLVRDIIREKKPDADFVFWTYNWGYVDAEPRVELIRNLPRDISLNVTYEMFEKFNPEEGVQTRCVDYTLFFEGPGQYFVSEAIAAKEQGIALYTMCNTGGLSWDIGVIPYEPAPYQWKRRYDGLLRAHRDWGLRGLMESHHYGFWPSFVSELANASYWEPAQDYETAMREIAARDYGAGNADSVLEVWRLYSDGIRKYVSTNEDQYGPFRVGPAYPLLFQQEAEFPSRPFAHFGGNMICNPMYRYDLSKIKSLQYEMRSLEEMKSLYRQGNELLEGIVRGLEGRQKDVAEHLLALGRFIECCVRTTLHVKQWYLLKCRLLPPEKGRNIWAGGQSGGDVKEAAAEALSPAETLAVVAAMREVAEKEIANTEAAIPLVEFDSRLGYEPSMEYMADAAHLRWKIEMTRRALAELEPIEAEARAALAGNA